MSVSAQGTDLASRINTSRPFLATRDVRMLLLKGEPPQQHVLIQAQVPTEAMLTPISMFVKEHFMVDLERCWVGRKSSPIQV